MVKLTTLKNLLRLSLFRNFGIKSGPRTLSIFPTATCNLRCPMCPFDHSKSYQLGHDEIKQIILDAKRMGTKTLRISGGGEPFCHPKLLDILAFAKKQGFFVQITTNGTLLSEKVAKELIRLKIDQVQVSFDAPRKGAYEKIRGKGNFAKVTKNVRFLISEKASVNTQLPQVGFATLLMKETFKYTKEMVEFAHSLGVRHISFGTMVTEGEADAKQQMPEKTITNFLKDLKEVKRLSETLGVNVGGVDRLMTIGKPAVLRNLDVRACYAPWDELYINERGKAYICCYTMYRGRLLGDIRKNSLREIWNDEPIKQLRKRFKKDQLFPECSNCNPFTVENYSKVDGILRPFKKA